MSIQTYESNDYIYIVKREEFSSKRLAPELLKNPSWSFECQCGEILDWKINLPAKTFDRRDYYEETGDYIDLEKLVCPYCKRDISDKHTKYLMWSAKLDIKPLVYIEETIYTRESKKDGSIINMTKQEFEKALKIEANVYKKEGSNEL